MKKSLLAGAYFFISALLIASTAEAQRVSLGLSYGITSLFGDLGGANNIGRPLFYDFKAGLLKPSVTVSLIYSPNSRIAFRGSFTFTKVVGEDKLLDSTHLFSYEWFRWYRNLSFRSNIEELSLISEINIQNYFPGSKREGRWTPYILAGIGIFHFNPQAYYNGAWIDLQPLHTEGEGFPQYPSRKVYSLYQLCIPLGAGVKYNLSNQWTMGFEMTTRKTFTDYIDDVSTKYVSYQDFAKYFANDPAMAATAYALSVRSGEHDPEGIHSIVTSPGQDRGHRANDQYLMAQITFAYVFPLKGWFGYSYHQSISGFKKKKSKCFF